MITFFISFAASAIMVLAGFSAGISQTSPSKDFAGIKIKNFGQMDERFYRGAQPKKEDFAALKALGIQTIVDLQAEPEEFEKDLVESLGMRYVNVPIVDKSYPTPENIALFLKIIDDPATGVFFAHCAGGRHRTGNMGALYRFTKYGWDFDQAYREMKNYDFYTRWGHGKQKDFVEDYAVKAANDRASAAAAKASESAASTAIAPNK